MAGSKQERCLGELLLGHQSIKLLNSLPSSFSSPFVLFLMSLLQVSRVCLSWTLASWVAGNSSSFFPLTHPVRKNNGREVETYKRIPKLQWKIVSPDA